MIGFPAWPRGGGRRPRHGRSPACRAALISVLAGLLVVAVLPPPAAGQSSELPACAQPPLDECRMATTRAVDPFSGHSVALFGLADVAGDGPLDLLGASWGEVHIGAERGAELRADRRFVSSGRRPRATAAGRYLYVRLDYAGGAQDAALHLALDPDGDAATNAPASRDTPGSPLAGSQVLLTWFPGQGKAFSSDFARSGFYRARVPFLVLDDGLSVHLLVSAEDAGASIAPVAFTPGVGWDTLDGVFRGRVPADGAVGLMPDCARVETAAAPLLVPELAVDGEVFEDLELPVRRDVTACFPIADDVASALAGMAGGAATFAVPVRTTVVAQGVRSRQVGDLRVTLDGERVCLSHAVGLTQLGYHAVTAIDPEPTGSRVADAFLARAAASMLENVPPSRADRRPGLVLEAGETGCGLADLGRAAADG